MKRKVMDLLRIN
ncbi:UNVERIFIED_CONTAM: hypothetical protein GTU68_022428 [Idotea baltica]|nr:hypothetical protein [Idotea baltica]